jgi:hypothetical protein
MYGIIADINHTLKRTKKIDPSVKEFIKKNQNPIHESIDLLRKENNIISSMIFTFTYNFFSAFEEEYRTFNLNSNDSLLDKVINFPFRKSEKYYTLKKRYGFSPEEFLNQTPSDNLTVYVLNHYIDYLIQSIRSVRLHLYSENCLEFPYASRQLTDFEKKIDNFISRIENIRHAVGPLVQKLRRNKDEISRRKRDFIFDLNTKLKNGEEVVGYISQGLLTPIGTKIILGRGIRIPNTKKDLIIYVKVSGKDELESVSFANIIFLK